MSSAIPTNQTDEPSAFVPLSEVSRLLGRTPNAVKSMALIGAIRTHSLPGCRITYSINDARRILEATAS